MFQVAEELARLARAEAEKLVGSGEARASVQESPDSPSFLLTKDEGEVLLIQRIDVGGEVFYLGLPKPT